MATLSTPCSSGSTASTIAPASELAGRSYRSPLDTFQHDDNTWRPAQPLEGESDAGAQWFDRLREALTSHPVMGQRFEPEGGDVWSYEDGFGRRWQVTFDPIVADASGGQVGLFVWGHPAFPRL